MAGENGKNMSLLQFVELLEEIMAKHAWMLGVKGHAIKYVRPHFDTRTGDFYGVTFEGVRGKKDFFVVNEDRDRDLYVWIKEFLDSDPGNVQWESFHTKDKV